MVLVIFVFYLLVNKYLKFVHLVVQCVYVLVFGLWTQYIADEDDESTDVVKDAASSRPILPPPPTPVMTPPIGEPPLPPLPPPPSPPPPPPPSPTPSAAVSMPAADFPGPQPSQPLSSKIVLLFAPENCIS
jgi:hypothetical protein